MKKVNALALVALCIISSAAVHAASRDSERDLLVTFENPAFGRVSGGIRAPYRHRQRYNVSVSARRSAAQIAEEFQVDEIDRWPIRSLSVYCVVYRADSSAHRDRLIELLTADARVESAQPLQTFVSGMDAADRYDDAYATMQHGLVTMSVASAHRHARGDGTRVLVVDSEADADHEDLRGRLGRVERFVEDDAGEGGEEHGTAIASVIGANANNAVGIVGIAPGSRIDLYAACWSTADDEPAVCDSFSLARALDAAILDPPDIVNLSLTGPGDALLRRLLISLHEAGVVVIAAAADEPDADSHFPASVSSVIGVATSRQSPLLASLTDRVVEAPPIIYAPGEQILVAVPGDTYAFRSGSSLAAAHVSGVVALMLSASPDLGHEDVAEMLRQSQKAAGEDTWSVDACVALSLVDRQLACF